MTVGTNGLMFPVAVLVASLMQHILAWRLKSSIPAARFVAIDDCPGASYGVLESQTDFTNIASQFSRDPHRRVKTACTLLQCLNLVALVLLATAAFSQTAFTDKFDAGQLNHDIWFAQHGDAPDNKPGNRYGAFEPDQLDFSQGMIRLAVSQTFQGPKAVSRSSEIISQGLYGYGTYTFVMRMASTSPTHDGAAKVVSGSCSAAFLLWKNSLTEIDIEYLGNQPNSLFFSSWIDRNHKNTIEAHVGNVAEGMHKYDIVWKPGMVQWYLDGKLVATSTKFVPTHPATIRINHWGTHNPGWGGLATASTNRYMYVKSASFAPWEAK
jgi:beta-glucanase (GH16 family)